MKVLYTALVLVLVTRPAHAYLDAGSGSYLFQLSVAGIMALVFTGKLYWRRFLDLVAGRTRKPAPKANDRSSGRPAPTGTA